MMKKFMMTVSMVLLMAGLIVVGALAVSYEDEDAVFNVMVADGTAYDGYLFQLADGAEPIPADGIEHVADDIYLAESVADIQAVYDGGDVDYIEPNGTLQLLETPNDTYYSHQEDYMNLINAPAFWDMDLTGAGVRIGIIDSGVSSYADLDSSRILGYNYLDGNQNITDTLGHGTMVADIIMATRNNGAGIAGLLSGVEAVALKVTNTDEILVNKVVAAVYGAVDDYGCQVLNMSMGGSDEYNALQAAINYAISKDVIVVAAVGNTGNGTLNYPAAYDGVIGVGAVKSDGSISSYSNRNSSVFVTAPGEGIAAIDAGDGKYYSNTGTSCAAPFVSAMAAVSKAKWGSSLSVSSFKTILQNSVSDAGASGYDTTYGYGIIDLEKFGNYHTSNPFYDVVGHWGYNSIQRAYAGSLFSGTGNGTFEPNTNMTRAMYVTVLGKMYENAGGTINRVSDTFTDTDKSAYYTSFVAWAAENGIVAGYGGGAFGPNDSITREQAAEILYKFTKNFLGNDVGTVDQSVLSGYADNGNLSSWARESMAWTIQSNIITGVSATSLDPKGTASRAQVATILIKYLDAGIWSDYVLAA